MVDGRRIIAQRRSSAEGGGSGEFDVVPLEHALDMLAQLLAFPFRDFFVGDPEQRLLHRAFGTELEFDVLASIRRMAQDFRSLALRWLFS